MSANESESKSELFKRKLFFHTILSALRSNEEKTLSEIHNLTELFVKKFTLWRNLLGDLAPSGSLALRVSLRAILSHVDEGVSVSDGVLVVG